MKLTEAELQYLSAWANEEHHMRCYQLPAHRLQLCHGIKGAALINLIKAWVISERRQDHEIFDVHSDSNPAWPWYSAEECIARLQHAEKVCLAAMT